MAAGAIAAAACSFTAQAQGADWRWIGSTPEYAMFADAASITGSSSPSGGRRTRASGILQMQVRRINLEQASSGRGHASDSMQIRCADQTFRRVRSVDAAGRAEDAPASSRWLSPPAGSTASQMIVMACAPSAWPDVYSVSEDELHQDALRNISQNDRKDR